jgi:hypothetical protein
MPISKVTRLELAADLGRIGTKIVKKSDYLALIGAIRQGIALIERALRGFEREPGVWLSVFAGRRTCEDRRKEWLRHIRVRLTA